MINGSPIVRERSVEAQLEYYKKLCASQNLALDKMQKGRDALAAKVVVAEQSAKNAEDALYIQRGIVRNMVTISNADKQQAAERIHELEDELNGDQH